LVEQGVPSEEAASEHGRRGGAGNRLKGKFVDLHGYFVVQEIDKNNVPCNPRTDRKSTSWSSIAMYLASDNVMIRYAASSIVKKQKFKPVGYVDKILTPKNNKDKRRWRVWRGHSIPSGIATVEYAEIEKEYTKFEQMNRLK
jgi:hypothetical protein